MEYLSPQGVLLPLVYGTTASPLWLELRGRSAWQETPSWTVYRLACHRLHPWLRVTFAIVPDAAWPGSDQQPWSTAPATGPVGSLGRPSVSDPWGVGSFPSPGRPTCVRCPGPPGSCSPVCPLGVLCCVCGVLGLPAPVHRCARSVWCVVCAVSEQTEFDSYTLPLIEDMLQRQHGRRLFTVIDLKDDYHQMLLAPESRACTALSTRLGPLQWKVMPMGCKNGNASFERMLEELLKPVADCADPFVDDIIVGSGTEGMTDEEVLAAHEADLRRVLELLLSLQLTGSADKATITVNEVEFAGHVVGMGQRKPIPGKIAAVEIRSAPKQSRRCEPSSDSAITTRVMSVCMQKWPPR